jgi:hypothetical protein
MQPFDAAKESRGYLVVPHIPAEFILEFCCQVLCLLRNERRDLHGLSLQSVPAFSPVQICVCVRAL